MAKEHQRLISVSPEVKAHLEKAKLIPMEPYDNVLKRLLKIK